MTILYDPVCWGAEHSPVNAAMLATVLEAFPNEDCTFFAEGGHLQSVRELLPTATVNRIQWRDVATPARDCRDFRSRFIRERQIAGTVVAEAKRTHPSRLIACAVTTASIAALKWQLFPRMTGIRVAIVHHTGLGSLLGSRSTSALLEWMNGDSIRHIVLGDWIRERVLQIKASLGQSLFSLWHPYLFDDEDAQSLPEQGALRFGFLGVGTRGKGFDRFSDLATEIQNRPAPGGRAAEFELIGRPSIESPVSSAVSCAPLQNGFVSRSFYEERIRQMAYTVFPFPPDSYDMITSGSFIDTFAFLKPCIVLRHPMVEAYFAQMGDIGYVCESYQDMYTLLLELLQTPPLERYREQCLNLQKGRRVFEPPSVGRQLRAVFA